MEPLRKNTGTKDTVHIGHVKEISSTFLPDCFQEVAYTRVVAKKKVGIWLDGVIADRLDAMSERFDGQKGELVAAAIKMFLDADEKDQRAALIDVMGAKVDRLFGDMKPFKFGKAARKSDPEK